MHRPTPTTRPHNNRRLLHLVIALVAMTAVLAVPSAALASGITVKATFPKTNPVANKPWPIKLTVTKGHKKLSGKVHYNFLFQGTQVSTQPGHSFKKGVYTDKLKFPPKADGITLTLQVVIVTKQGTKDIDHTVTTQSS